VIRDLPILDAKVRLWVSIRRVACVRCGVRPELISWVDPSQQVTRRLAESVGALCAATTVRATAHHYHLDLDQVKRIDKTQLSAKLDPIELSGIDYLLMDEFAIEKGHRTHRFVDGVQTVRIISARRADRDEELQYYSL